mgnify:FL=1
MLNDERIIKNPLFEDLTQQEIEGILSCADARTVRVDRGGTVGLRDPKEPLFGILLSGSLSTTRYDAFGNRFLLLKAEAGEVFGLSMALIGSAPEDFFLTASEPSELLLMRADKVLYGCTSDCTSHRRLYLNIMRLLAKKNMALIRKQYHMAQRTLRRKLSSFLSEQSGMAKSKRFTVRMDRQELADYLGVDRSALCAELSRMRKEGLIDYYRHDFLIKGALVEEDPDY